MVEVDTRLVENWILKFLFQCLYSELSCLFPKITQILHCITITGDCIAHCVTHAPVSSWAHFQTKTSLCSTNSILFKSWTFFSIPFQILISRRTGSFLLLPIHIFSFYSVATSEIEVSNMERASTSGKFVDKLSSQFLVKHLYLWVILNIIDIYSSKHPCSLLCLWCHHGMPTVYIVTVVSLMMIL